LAIASIASAGAYLVGASRAPSEGVLEVAGAKRPISIRFDARCRAFVTAHDLPDALFAEGFLHATERLWQMELLRRAGGGRLAELLGADLLATDQALWRAGVPRLAATLARNAEPASRPWLEAYVAGVNAGRAALRVRPPEFLLLAHAPAPWSVDDVFAAGAMIAFDSANNADNELLRLALVQHVGAAAAAIFLPEESEQRDFPYGIGGVSELAAAFERFAALDAASSALPSAAWGSNGWAVSGQRTRSGAPLFAFDSHDTLALPNLFYEIHLFYGERQIRGWSTPGIPGVINGGNDRLLWGLTNIGDTQDLYVETRDPENPSRFRGSEGWYEAKREVVEIPVRGRSEPERLEIFTTRNGPLVSDDPPIALRWVGHDAGARGLDALLAMNTARDWDEFRAATDRHFAPATNVTYADVDGHVAFRTIGRLPRRGRGDGLVPQRGDDPAAAWRGTVPAADLPMRVDPPAGFVAAANARVTAPSDAVLVSADNAPGYRIRRIVDVLHEPRSFSLDDMRRLQVDWWNGQAALLLPELLAALAGAPAPLGATAERARELLVAWSSDPENAPARAAPLVFERWYRALADELFAARLGRGLYDRLLARAYVLNHAIDRLVLAHPSSEWWAGDRAMRMRSAFERAVRELAAELGTDPAAWRWDARHGVVWRHELGAALPLLGRWLDRGPYAWGGGSATVGRASSRYDRGLVATHGATVRVAAELSRPIRLHAVIAGGQSGHPASPHYADQIDVWLRGDLEPIARTAADVDGSELVLMPLRAAGPSAPPRSEPR
jgi:penicillin amidase